MALRYDLQFRFSVHYSTAGSRKNRRVCETVNFKATVNLARATPSRQQPARAASPLRARFTPADRTHAASSAGGLANLETITGENRPPGRQVKRSAPLALSRERRGQPAAVNRPVGAWAATPPNSARTLPAAASVRLRNSARVSRADAAASMRRHGDGHARTL